MYNQLHIDNLFHKLQEEFEDQYLSVFHNDLAPKAVVVIPSLTLDHHILSKVRGHFYYEERMLCMLMLLRMPETRLTFVTSIPISPLIIDYYLHMLPGITSHHARSRLTLLSCYDAGNIPLTEKVLRRPRLISRIKKSINNGDPAHIMFFNVTEAEKELAVKLNLPIYGCDPALNYLGTKSGSRTIFKETGILTPNGFENINSVAEITEAIYQLKIAKPQLEKAVIKLNDGFSGDGNAIFYYTNAPSDEEELKSWIQEYLKKNTKVVAKKLKFDRFVEKMEVMGGIVEEFINAETITSPSVQVRINPVGEICIISTHDQVLGGESGQVFIGATFPAKEDYAVELSKVSIKLAEKMKSKSVLGRFGIDFMSIKQNDIWQHYAIEINLRKGGTTHPFLMLQFLTNGIYIQDTGEYLLSDGNKRYYFATDNLQKEQYKGMTPPDLLDIVMYYGLHYDHKKEEGVMFHLISALSQFGKLGLVSIGKTPERAMAYYFKVIEVLDKETEIKQD
ncbi:MAG: ATP-grasp domain-containing protein [Saprospiraceae bacterium]|nr:ATP-grasp domain-containing protein [Saprospiraceae bacterium]